MFDNAVIEDASTPEFKDRHGMSVTADPLDLHYKPWSEVKLLAGLCGSGTSQMKHCVGRIVRCVSTAGTG